jgi:carbohydrate kinase (thermoresistant glucokinase family)
MTPTVLVLMGVSGSGKTTVGIQLAERMGWAFKEGDELHPPANIAKMHAGKPLSDADREPWLVAVAAWIDQWLNDNVCGVITCSALKRSYRRRLTAGRPPVVFVFLHAREAVLVERLAKRQGHFMPPSLLASQLATLEAPTPDEPVILVETDQPIAAQVDAVAQAVSVRRHPSSNLGFA